MAGATILLQSLGGKWEVLGVDRERGVWHEGLTCVADAWGPKTARFTLKRDPGQIYPDLMPFSPVVIEKNGVEVWSGFLDSSPQNDPYSVSVEAIGWQDHGDHDPFRWTWVHARLGDWKDVRSLLNSDLTVYRAGARVQTESGVIVIGYPNGYSAATGDRAGVTLDLGPSNFCERIVIDVEAINPSTNRTLVVRGHDGPVDGSDGQDIVSQNNAATGIYAGTFTTPRRYLTIYLEHVAGPLVAGNDHLVRVRAARVFRDAAYESGDQSILTVSDVLKDILPFCPLWSQDTSGIEDSNFPLPELAMTAERPPRELADSLNALHNYVLKLGQGQRLIFKPKSTVPMFLANEGHGCYFRDASRGDGRSIYNKAVGVGVNEVGEQVKVERYAGQQPGVVGELVSSPSVANPSFDTDLNGWVSTTTIFDRDTTIFDTSPASMKIDGMSPGDEFAGALFGEFEKDVAYRLDFRVRTSNGSEAAALQQLWEMRLGLPAPSNDHGAVIVGKPGTTWRTYSLIWIPKETTGDAQLRATKLPLGAAAGFWFDSFTISVVKPTLVDRRGFVRAKSLSITQAVNADVLEQMADVWLQGHARAPLKGDLEVVGRSLLRWRGGAGVDPAELLVHVGELIHLGSERDPDTGASGRDAPIAQVTYNDDDETAQVALDASRENFETIIGRYDVIAGAGR